MLSHFFNAVSWSQKAIVKSNKNCLMKISALRPSFSDEKSENSKARNRSICLDSDQVSAIGFLIA